MAQKQASAMFHDFIHQILSELRSPSLSPDWHTKRQITNKLITKDPTSPQTRYYATVRNISSQQLILTHLKAAKRLNYVVVFIAECDTERMLKISEAITTETL